MNDWSGCIRMSKAPLKLSSVIDFCHSILILFLQNYKKDVDKFSDSIYIHVDFITNGSNWMSIFILYLYQRIVIRNFVYDRPCWVRIDVILLKLRDILLSRFISVLCIICLINDNKWILVLLLQNIFFIFPIWSVFMVFYYTFINSSLSGILAITGRVVLWLI